MSLWLLSGVEAPVVALEQLAVTKTKEGATSPECSKTRDIRFLFDLMDVIYREDIPPGWTFSSDFYFGNFEKLERRCSNKKVWNCGTTASVCCIRTTRPLTSASRRGSFLTENNMVEVPHPPYSPDLPAMTSPSSPK